MNVGRSAWVIGGAFAIGVAGLGLVACSGDDTNPSSPSVDSGSGDSTTSPGQDGSTADSATPDGGAADANAPGTDSGPGATDGGAEAACDKKPTLHAAGPAGPYCPFIDGGKGANCGADQLCCLEETTSLLNGSCQTTTACPAPTAFYFQCSGPSNCNVGSAVADGGDAGDHDAGPPMFCCGLGPTPTVDGTCPSYDLATGLSATVCSASSTCSGLGDGGTALVICDTATGQCPTGTTCTPFRTHGAELGYCM